MRAISGRDASCRATSLPIPALAPVINTDFTGVVLIVIASPDWNIRSIYRPIIWHGTSNVSGMLLLMSAGSSDRRRLTRKGAETRARIVDAAAQLIYAQ